MRSKNHSKIKKSGTRTKISKKKNARLSNRSSGFSSDIVSNENLQKINETIRINKSNCAEGRGSWKLLPKDSCEVYKERRRKLQSQEQRNEDSLSEDSQNRTRDKTRPKETNKKVKKKVRRARRERRRPRSDSSIPSCSSCSSMCTTCGSTSDMDYE